MAGVEKVKIRVNRFVVAVAVGIGCVAVGSSLFLPSENGFLPGEIK